MSINYRVLPTCSKEDLVSIKRPSWPCLIHCRVYAEATVVGAPGDPSFPDVILEILTLSVRISLPHLFLRSAKDPSSRQNPLKHDAPIIHLVFRGPGWSQCITGWGLGTPLAEGFNFPPGAYNETTEAITTFLSADNPLRSITAMSLGSASSVRKLWATQGWLLPPECALCRPARGIGGHSAPQSAAWEAKAERAGNLI